MKSLFFSLMKRTKNQGCGIVVKARFFRITDYFDSMRFILFTSEMLILPVIFCEATDKL